MNIKLPKIILVIAVVFQACSSQVYNNKTYLQGKDISGKKVAIMPVQVEFTGKLPQGYSLQEKIAGEETESTLFQNSLYSEYLYKAKKGSRKQKAVQLINPDQINSRLKDHGISIRQSWTMSPDSLAKIIGADLILKAHVKKNRIMSESASFGIGVATTVLGSILSRNGNTQISPDNGGRTYTINIDATLTDATNNTVITRLSDQQNANWSHSPESLINATNKKIVRKGAVHAEK
jgi:hypothetical protein